MNRLLIWIEIFCLLFPGNLGQTIYPDHFEEKDIPFPEGKRTTISRLNIFSSINIDVNSEPEKQFKEVCFHWYRMQVNSEHDPVTKAWGMTSGIFKMGLHILTPYVYDTSTNRFTLYLRFEGQFGYFAKEFSRISGLNISEADMPSMMLSVTNNSVSLNRVIGMNGTQPQLQLVKMLDNPVEFINMTLGAYFAFENHRTPLF